jgi:hypothetical protein
MWALGLVWEERGVSMDVRWIVDVAVNCYSVYDDMKVLMRHVETIAKSSLLTTFDDCM